MSPSASALRALAPAKLNLTLRVLGRRADGFHELATTILALEHGDLLALGPRAEGAPAVRIEGPAASSDVPADASNLAWRAVEAVAALARERGLAADPRTLSVGISKRVPSGAGLGGGSADAAAAALAAARWFGLDAAAEPEIGRALAVLGSDCPFFLLARRSGLGACTGRGEIVRPLPPASAGRAFCVLTPGVHAPTAAVYAALDAPVFRPAADARPPDDPLALLAAPLAEARSLLVNDLEPAALAAHEGLARFRSFLDASGARHFRLAGSGASFFGMFDDEASARACRAELEARAAEGGLGLRAAFVTRAANRGATLLSSN